MKLWTKTFDDQLTWLQHVLWPTVRVTVNTVRIFFLEFGSGRIRTIDEMPLFLFIQYYRDLKLNNDP